MKILHTSDWHLGRSLYGRKRYQEFSEFLDWLARLIDEQQIDALLVAGDIFDTGTPSNRAQHLYYRFLCRVARSSCRHVVIIAGNHDSPTFLDAPKELLRAMNVYVVGAVSAEPQDEIIILKDQEGTPAAIICAVPYLRDKDLRSVEAGESVADKDQKLRSGLKQHYQAVCEKAEELQQKLGEIPIVAMGHLFAAGGKTLADDGVRELYVGSLAHVGSDIFPGCIDYLALGHLHVPQCLDQLEHMRYSGSPIPIGFGEAAQQKLVILARFKHRKLQLEAVPVPRFQALERINGSLAVIHKRISELKAQDSTAWLEIEYNGDEIISDLKQRIDELLQDSALEVLRLKNKRIFDRVLAAAGTKETLDELDQTDVFQRCLDSHNVAPEERPELQQCYLEIINALHESDNNAE